MKRAPSGPDTSRARAKTRLCGEPPDRGLIGPVTALAEQVLDSPELVPQTTMRTMVFLDSRHVLKAYLRDREARFSDCRSSRSSAEASALGEAGARGLPVPRVLDAGIAGSATPWLLMTRLPGDHPCFHFYDMHWSPAAWPVQYLLGRLLGDLHRLLAAAVGHDDLSAQQDRLARVSDIGRWLRARAAIDGRVHAATAELTRSWPGPPSMAVRLHGDYGHRNVLVTGGDEHADWAVTGVIDFEDSRIGDPVEDLVNIMFLASDSDGARSFLRGYRERNPAVLDDPASTHRLAVLLAERALRVIWMGSQRRDSVSGGYLAAAYAVLARLADAGGNCRWADS